MPDPYKPTLLRSSFTALSNRVDVGSEMLDVSQHEAYVAELELTSGSGGTFDGVIEDSSDQVNWFDWIAFTQVSAAAKEVVVPTRPPLGFVRRKATVGVGGTGFAGTIKLLAESKRGA